VADSGRFATKCPVAKSRFLLVHTIVFPLCAAGMATAVRAMKTASAYGKGFVSRPLKNAFVHIYYTFR
jgi:hypothetical protein